MSENGQGEILTSLKPTKDLKVMDLVEEAGIDVGPWAVKKNGSPVANPKANPNYCYDWAFGGNGEPIALCIWHGSLEETTDGIAYVGNMRALAARIEEVGFSRTASPEMKSRAKSQAKRCDRFDQRVQIAYRKSLPVHVILLQGQMADDLGHDSSNVDFRRLDESQWWVHEYNDATGDYKLIRGQEPDSDAAVLSDGPDKSPVDAYADQFSILWTR